MATVEDLEFVIDETVRRAVAQHYTPSTFMQMRTRWGTVEAMRRLVVSGDIQSGFTRLAELGLVESSIEATVLKFPNVFDKDVRKAAQWRLDQLNFKSAT